MSNLIKSSSVIALDQLKQLYWLNKHAAEQVAVTEEIIEEAGPDEETISIRDQIISDAQIFAEERIREAGEQCEQMLAKAEAEIDAWWLEKRLEDERHSEASRQAGFEQGYAEGRAHAEQALQQEWESRLEEANAVLKSAYEMREQIIQEAEPFLVELSVSISEKVIGKQLSEAPDMALELIRKALSRRREQGVIALCVAPGQLAFVQAAREELNLVIDSQAELQIIPDATVKDFGCVIRSAYGSIDARIDTQLSEIKRELVQLANQSHEERSMPDERY
ncbi:MULTISPECIES: FliH/SctL family protein [unclassified Paenibacillus]|uniref:FliH/SctL family protein n=1 Tax=unclassified Paenibacillus TaxID=185978 RepID=UPI00104853B9|nr:MULTISPECIES: FliH/SctL family protein [unclassified Paenibacillus]NIK68827.1 flagellar assembly protein FliH [Paenibacillus sp. BK720]TCM98900.1 flagellar assembly protein FliH [Paenibacillus sp. BK033]